MVVQRMAPAGHIRIINDSEPWFGSEENGILVGDFATIEEATEVILDMRAASILDPDMPNPVLNAYDSKGSKIEIEIPDFNALRKQDTLCEAV